MGRGHGRKVASGESWYGDARGTHLAHRAFNGYRAGHPTVRASRDYHVTTKGKTLS